MITEAITNPSAEQSTIRLNGVPWELAARLTDLDTNLASWVIVTTGRVPEDEVAGATRGQIAAKASNVALLTKADRSGATIDLTTSPLSWLLSRADNQVQAEVFPSLYYGQSNLTIAQAAELIVGPPGNALYQVVRGTTLRAASAPTTVNLDDTWHDPLDFAAWIASSFEAKWRVRMGAISGEPWPTLDIAPADTLWGASADTNIVVSPVLDRCIQPRAGSWLGTAGANAPIILKARTARGEDGSGMTSRVYATQSDSALWAASPYGVASNPLVGPQHVNGLGPLQRDRIISTQMEDPTTAQLNASARSSLGQTHKSIEEWTVELEQDSDSDLLPLGAPVAVFDPAGGVFLASNVMESGVQGANPVAGFRVSERRRPFDPDRNGLYVAFSSAWDEVVDLTRYAEPVEGSATIRWGSQAGFSARASLVGSQRRL